MDIVERIVSAAATHGVRFLLTGGHAVAVHGYGRTTKDVDILVCKDDRTRWLAIMTGSGCTLHHDGGTFLQFKASASDGWPVDLMLVSAATFGKMLAESITARLGPATVPVVSLNHLLSLKLFALKQKQSHRAVKDMDDLLNLILKNAWTCAAPLSGKWRRNMAMPDSTKKSAKPSVPETATAAAFQPKPPDLELPDWSGCDREAPPMTLTEMHRLSEQLLRSARKLPAGRLADFDMPCPAEFTL